MSLSTESNLEKTIHSMLKELGNYHNDRDEIMKDCIQKRLTRALKEYYNDISNTYLYLEYRNEQSLLSKYKRTL